MGTQPSARHFDVSAKMRWRYATKKFDAAKKICPEVWSQIEQALILTPSSFGLQPWKFLVITDQKVKDKLPPFSWNQLQVSECSHLVVLCRREKIATDYVDAYVDLIAKTRGVSTESMASFRKLMLGFIQRMNEEKLADWMSRQCYIALGNLMTAASVLDVDNCPLEGFSSADYDRILELPEKGLRSVVACALGYRADDDKYAALAKVRFPAEQVVLHI